MRARRTNALGLDTIVGPELLLEAGRHEQARETLARGLASVPATRRATVRGADGDPGIAKLALRLGPRHRWPPERPWTGSSVSRRRRGSSTSREFVDVWYGLALLLESEPAPALVRLRRATTSMLAGGRIARAADRRGVPRGGRVARRRRGCRGPRRRSRAGAARRQGSNHILLQALADFPAVVSRRIDAEPGADSPWHELGRALIAQGVAIDARAGVSVSLREFGSPAIVVDGKAARPRIAKSYELLAYLASRRGSASRPRGAAARAVRRSRRRVHARLPAPGDPPAAPTASHAGRARRRARPGAARRRHRAHDRVDPVRIPARRGRAAAG